MTFNPELMREILLLIEAVPAGEVFNGSIKIEGYDWKDAHAIALNLVQDGWFVEKTIVQRDSQGFPNAFVLRDLSMKGHEFLANARNNTVWKKVLAKAQAEGSSVGISVLNGMLKKAAQKYAGLDDD